MYYYLKAIHIIFVVCWFAGLFYMPRLLIYNREAQDKTEPEKSILATQYKLMQKRLWFGIAWPSAIITLIMGLTVLFVGKWDKAMVIGSANWLWIKMAFVILLYGYHFTIHVMFRQQQKDVFKYTSQQLRIWNEVATVLLFAIVFLATVKQSFSFVYGIIGIAALVIVLMLSIRIYARLRKK
ncbi:MAG: protoporphyrinogen IX oxidase [Pseudopedobacter saltans]|uniref:Protoporphyrinogen IX oxidase n=1 Tax=Pseudopedobacter saltans TaxID=151895 RepID=A0A2W5EZP2_9SPHI|nr:MAG: protoporphyrinogen IX oxidase [Pseudopedobacter saltans]